jgi:hypothetical protein
MVEQLFPMKSKSAKTEERELIDQLFDLTCLIFRVLENVSDQNFVRQILTIYRCE